ncbi:MAG: hypothetical protein HUU20_05240 [Pirellulales bacterium]|nr:hypothetical protein [Pirellulales bacterium]
MGEYWWIFLAAAFFVAGLVLIWRPIRSTLREIRFAEACRDFHRQRERLEAKFVHLGVASAKPDSPRWSDCDFDNDVTYARNRLTGELTAFVAVTIEMENGGADGPSGGSDTIGNLRAATAVFRLDGHHWETDGRAIFNLSPAEAIRFHRDLELVGQELAQRS